jgi:hypothetical protein
VCPTALCLIGHVAFSALPDVYEDAVIGVMTSLVFTQSR